jgi:hypothetical protein
VAIAERPLGRGLDDPRIDVSQLSNEGFQTLDPRGRHGQYHAFAHQYNRGSGPKDPQTKKLFKLMRSIKIPGEKAIAASPSVARGFHSYLRKYAPDTDFAFTVWDSAWGTSINRNRGLAINRKARELLRADGLLKDEDCTPALIVNEPPERSEDLDRRYGPPAPAYSSEQWAQMRKLEAQVWAEHVAHPKPPPAPNLARSLAMLRSRKRSAPEEFAKPASPKALAEVAKDLSAAIPTVWQKVLQISNGGRIDKSPLADRQGCNILSTDKLTRSRRGEVAYFQNLGTEIADTMLLAMQTEIGDSVWLDTSLPAPTGDCRVILMSHETGEQEREWPSITEFLEELLTSEED